MRFALGRADQDLQRLQRIAQRAHELAREFASLEPKKRLAGLKQYLHPFNALGAEYDEVRKRIEAKGRGIP